MGERITVVLGAGASFDVDTGSTPRTDEEWKPPLVRDLFEGKETFYSLRRPYPGAVRLAQVLHHRAAAGTLNMEEELRALAESPDPITRRDFLDIPPYLRDLMYTVRLPAGKYRGRVQGYVIRPGAYALLLHELLVTADSEVAFVVMNYDTLLERSLTEYDATTYKFNSLNDYVEPGRKALVVKPHGSVNWWAPLGQKIFNVSWDETLSALSLEVIRANADRKFHSDDLSASHEASMEVDGSPHWMYPLITAPLANKEESDFVCPTEHLQALSAFMQTCQRYLFIGTSGFDSNLLSFMAKHMPSQAAAEFVFGGDEAARGTNNESRDRIVHALPSLMWQPSATEPTQRPGDTHMSGFAKYLLTRRAQTLATLPLETVKTQILKRIRS